MVIATLLQHRWPSVVHREFSIYLGILTRNSSDSFVIEDCAAIMFKAQLVCLSFIVISCMSEEEEGDF